MGIGEYVVERALGHGKFDAHHAVLDRRVTITISADAAPLVREARVLERLRHPHVPRLYECHATRSQGDDAAPSFWIAVERIDRAPIAPADALAATRDLAAILAHAHERGVVHGALGADAIAWHDGEAWIVDWSAARFDDRAAARADDVAALGALARALTGASGPFAPLVARMIDRDPARRPSAADVRVALATGAASDDEPPVEEIVLEELDSKLRWTPAFGIERAPAGGAARVAGERESVIDEPEKFACPDESSDACSRRHDRRPDRYRAR